jgi:hypothetical protein
MITEYMTLTTTRDERQWASDITEGWEGDADANTDAMAQAIHELKPGWGCTKAELDWDAIERRAYEILG